ncbi:NADP-dependent oxidoreductase domain-containing protein [Scleroderma yunnanense]
MSYPTRRIGDDNVSAIGFGAMSLSAFYGPVGPDEERFKVLDAALQHGCNFWDTANIYGDSEELIGKWFKRTGKRDKIFLATKFGLDRSKSQSVDGTPEYARSCLKLSLERLGVETIDLYYLHRPDPTVPIETTVGAMAEFVKAGKVKYLGLSECSASTLRRAHAVHPIAALQVEYSPFTLDIEDPKIGLLETARELGIKIVAYSPLGRGLLTGQYKSPDDFAEDDFRRRIPRFSKENFPNILKLVNKLQEFGLRHNTTAGQGDDIIPIPGTKKIKYLKENMDAVKVNLTPQEAQDICEFARKADWAVGDRAVPEFVRLLYADTPELKEG